MKNILRISMIVCFGLFIQVAGAQDLNTVGSEAEPKSTDKNNLDLAEDKDKSAEDVKRQNEGVFKVQIFESTSRAELKRYKEKAAERGIDIEYETVQIINGDIEAISISVDCNDGYSGSAATTDMPESGIGFIRDYSEDAEVPFAIGKIFDENEDSDKDSDEDYQDLFEEFKTSFNKEKVVKKDHSSIIDYDHELNFSLGLNNYLNDNNQFPENDNKDFSLDPLRSWTYGLHSNNIISVSHYVKFNFLFGLQWNNFSLADNNFQFTKAQEQVELINTENSRPDINPEKSKLNITYLNLNLVPMFHLGKSSNAFRFGAGPFGSYRIASKSKFKYDGNGKDVIKNNFHINNWKYGIRAQVGWKGVDLFATYDLSPIFIENRGPEADYPLRAISFGIIL